VKDEYKKAVTILSELLELDESTKEKINRQIKNFGIVHFLDNLDSCIFSEKVRNKLQILYIVLRYMDLNRVEELLESGGESNG